MPTIGVFGFQMGRNDVADHCGGECANSKQESFEWMEWHEEKDERTQTSYRFECEYKDPFHREPIRNGDRCY